MSETSEEGAGKESPPAPKALVERIESEGIERDKAEKIAIEVIKYYAGPLPPPWVAEEYERLAPGSFERILRAFEAEGSHRRALEKRRVEAEIESARAMRQNEKRGQNYGWIICMTAILVAPLCLLIAPNFAGATLGSVLGGGGLTGLVVAFVRVHGNTTTSGDDGE